MMEGCDCLFCQGQESRRLVLISFPIAEAAGLVELARKDRVTIKPTDQIFAVEGRRAVGCVRMIRRRLARLCGCWVHPDDRGKGLGEFLVRARIAYVERHTSAFALDTFAFRKQLFLSLGFEPRQGFRIGTTVLRKGVSR